MSDIVFLNGDFLKAEDAKVSIFDRGYLFGDGIYEVVPVINGKVIDKAPFCKAEIITILDTLIARYYAIVSISALVILACTSFFTFKPFNISSIKQYVATILSSMGSPFCQKFSNGIINFHPIFVRL